MWARLRSFARALLGRDRFESDLSDEIAFHLTERAADLERSGLAPEAARRQARLEFGAQDLVKDDARQARGLRLVDELRQDLRYAIRMLRRHPIFAASAVLSLAIGIGMNAAIFTLVDAVLLRSLPVRSPDELVLAAERDRTGQRFSLTLPQFHALDDSPALASVAAFRPWRLRVTVRGASTLAEGQLVSAAFFPTLGVRAERGRTITADDDKPGAPLVAVVSDGYWRRMLGGDSAALGGTLEIQGAPFTVVGILAPPFDGLEPGKAVDITLPLQSQSVVMPGTALLTSPTARWLRVVGRLAPGVTRAQAEAAVATRWAALDGAAAAPPGDAARSRVEFVPGGQGLYDLRRLFATPLRMLMAIAALVLLVACANLSSVLLARAAGRRQEIDLRFALGAGRARLLRQLLTESLFLAALGALAGIALAGWVAPMLVQAMSRGQNPIAIDLAWHVRPIVFTVLVTVTVTVLFGAWPALRAIDRVDLKSSRSTPRRAAAGATLIAAEIALCCVVMVSALLLLGTLRNLRRIDAGFRPDHVLLISIRPGISGYEGQRAVRLFQDVYDRFTNLPGVQSVSLSMDTPLGGVSYSTGASAGSASVTVGVNSVGPRFFETMRTPIVAGRDIAAGDDVRAEPVAIVSESAARALFPDRDPIGGRVSIAGSAATVVGVVKDTRYGSLRAPAQPMIYRPYPQMPDTWEELSFAIRTADDPGATLPLAAQALRDVAPTVPMYFVSTLDDRVDRALVQERIVSSLGLWLGGFTLLLVGIGLYGRLALGVVSRTREIGVRLALGARPWRIAWEVLRGTLAQVLAGLALGVPAAAAATRAVRGLLYGVGPSDPATLAVVGLALLLMAAIASFVPARRASRVDPLEALRTE